MLAPTCSMKADRAPLGSPWWLFYALGRHDLPGERRPGDGEMSEMGEMGEAAPSKPARFHDYHIALSDSSLRLDVLVAHYS